VVAHAFNPSTWEAETGGFLSSRSQPGLQSEFQESQSYTEKPCLEKPKKKKKKKDIEKDVATCLFQSTKEPQPCRVDRCGSSGDSPS
jgi:hypothetical protein